MTWEAPVAGSSVTYSLDDGTPESGESVNPGYDVRMGNKYETDDEGVLRSVLILGLATPGAENNDEMLTVEVYDNNRQLIGSSDPFRLPEDAWVNVPLDNVHYSGTYYVMVRWENLEGVTNRLATDMNGEHAQESLSWAYANDAWTDMYTAFRTQCVFMIRPNALMPDESATATPESYALHRLAVGTESEPESWTLLTTTTDLSYTDTEWPTLPEGKYRYAVTAVYAGENNISEAAFTKSMTVEESGVAEVVSDSRLNVYFDQASDILYVDSDAEVISAVVVDMSGRTFVAESGNLSRIDLSMLSASYYIAHVKTETGEHSVKIIKQ